MERRQRSQACRCQEEDHAGIEFQKILESEEAGIVIYRYVPDTNNAGNGESYIIKNTKKQQATSEDFTLAFEQNKIICPRCVKTLEHAESLVKYIPLIESQDAVSICDHCHRKGQKKQLRSSCWCRRIVNTFLIGRQLEEVKSRKHHIKQWLLEGRQALQNDSSRNDKIVTGRIRNQVTIDKDVAQVDHVPFQQVEPTDSPPTGLKVRQPPFPDVFNTELHGLMRRDPSFDNDMTKVNQVDGIKFKQLESTDGPSTGLKVRKTQFPESVHTDSHGLMRHDPSFDSGMTKVNQVDDIKFKPLEPTDAPSTGLKVRKTPFPESVHTDSHGLMRRDPSLDTFLQKNFEKHLLNGFYKKKEKQLEQKERKETAPFKVASFLDVPEENVNSNMFVISKSQEGKIKETQRRPSLKREKSLAIGNESRGLPVTSNRRLPKGSLKPDSEHDGTKVFSFVFPQNIIVPTSSSLRFPSSTEILKNMQDMFKAQAEKKRAEEDDFKRKRVRERDKNKVIDAAQLIIRENDEKSKKLTKDTDSSSGFGKDKIMERTSINKEASRNENAYTAAETNENKDHKKKGMINKQKQEQGRIDKQGKKTERLGQIHKNKDKFSDVKDETLKGIISKDGDKGATINDGKPKREKPGNEKFKPEKSKEDILKHGTGKEEKQKDLLEKDDKSKKKLQTVHRREELDTAQPTFKDRGVKVKDGTSKWEKPGDEKFKSEKPKDEKLKDVTGKEDKRDKKKKTDPKYTLVTSQPTLTLKELDISQPTFKNKGVTLKDATSKWEKPGDEKFISEKAKEEKLKDVTGKEDTKDKKRKTDIKYTLITSQPTLILKDNPETKVFNVVIPERPKPIMVVQNTERPGTTREIKFTKTREELILKLIKRKQQQYGNRERTKPKKKWDEIESMEAYALYNESDIMLELAELEESSKYAAPSKRQHGESAIIIGTQIVKEREN